MTISTKGRYALRFMIDLASHGDDACVNLKEIAARQEISVKYLEQIVIRLCQADLLVSVRGAHGGYCLTRPAKEYTVADILRATESSLCPVTCLEDDENNCPHRDLCTTLKFWTKLDEVIWNYLKKTTLAQLARGGPNRGCGRRTEKKKKAANSPKKQAKAKEKPEIQNEA